MATQESTPQVSEVHICNLALSWLAVSPITSLDTADSKSSWCKQNYPFIRDAVLEERMWSFALVREVSTTEDLDAWGQNYAHAMPLNWLQVFRVYRDAKQTPTEWCLEDGKILTQEGTVYLWGVKRVTDTRKFSQLFINALAARIAATGAIKFTEDKGKERDLWQRYAAFLREAAARDGQQGSNETMRSTSVIDARRRY